MDGIPRLAQDKGLVLRLINRLKEFSDWSQCQVLELAAHYTPGGEPEVFDLMNAVQDRLAHVNSAVVMAVVKLFLHLTLSMTATHQQASGRLWVGDILGMWAVDVGAGWGWGRHDLR